MNEKSNNSKAKLSTEEKLQNAIDELSLQNDIMERRAEELIIANKELVLQNKEKDKRVAELVIANKELSSENNKNEKHSNKPKLSKSTEGKTETFENKYQALFKSMPSGFVLFEAVLNDKGSPIDLLIIDANEKFALTTGLKLNEAVGKLLTKVLPGIEKDAADWIGTYSKVALTGILTELEQGSELLGYYYAVTAYKSGPNRCAVIFDDITEQKKSEIKLKESEERFKALIENNQDIISLTDDALNTTYRSPSNERIIGWTDEDLKVKGGINYFHPDDVNVFKTAIAEAIKKPGIPQPYISRYLHKNGHYIWLEGKATKLPDDSLVKGIIFNSVDVTERIELEHLLLKANSLARIGSWEVDLIKQTVYWNDITREIHETESGFVPDLATGINFYKEGPGRELITQKVNEAIELGKPWDVELQIVTAQNNERWIRSIGETEFVDGKCVKIYGSIQDIDQRKKAEEKLIESVDRYRRLFDTSPVAITEEDHTPFYEKVESLRASGISKNYATYFHNHGEELYEMLGRVHILGVNQSLLDLTGANNLEDFVANRSKFFVSMTEMTVFKLMDLIRDGGGYFEEETKIKSLSGEIREVVVRLNYPAAPPYNSVAITMRDVTKQKEFEQKITESEEKYRLLFENSGEAILMAKPNGEILSANPAACTIFGRTEAEICSVGRNGLVNLDDPRLAIILEQRKRTGKIKDDLTFIRKDGTIFPGEISSTIFTLPGGEVRTSMIVRDISERKKAEETLKEKEEKFSAIFKAAPGSMMLSSLPDGKALEVNDNFSLITGYSKEDILGKSTIDLGMWVAPETRDQFLSKLQTDGMVIDFEAKLMHKSGAILTGLVSGQIVFVQNRKYLVSSFFDITNRKKVEEEIQKLATIVQRSPEFIGIASLDAKVIYVNDGGKNMVGLESDITTTSMWDYFAPPDLEIFQNKTVPAIQKNGRWVGDIYLRNFQTGERIPVWMDVFYIYNQATNEPVAFATVTSDNRERKKAEKEILKTTKQLQQLTTHLQSIREEERKRIGREIHDELGQQLTAMHMDVVWIDKKIPGESMAIKNKLKSILSLLDGSNESVRKILNELRPSILDEHSLPEVLEWQGIQFTESTGISLEFRNGKPLPKLREDIINCIFRVYQETLTNITKYADADNVVTSLNIDKDNLIFTVEDNGKGFNTAKVRDKKSFGLLGIKERVRSVNGNFELISSPGKGTKIIISIPVHPHQEF